MTDASDRDDERDDPTPRVPEDERAVDAMLRAGGAQWRAEVPAVEFERPSSRVALLSRGARITATIGIAAAVVAIVLAGSAVLDRSASSVVPQGPTGTGPVSMGPMTSAPTTAGHLPINGIKDYRDGATQRRVVGRVMRRGATNFEADIRPGNSFPPVGSTLWAAWDVRTGEVLVGALGTSCSGEPLGMELTADQEVLVSLTVTAGTSSGTCPDQQWHVTSFLAPTGLDPWSDATLTTGQGNVALAAIGGIQALPVPESKEPTMAVPRSGGAAGPAVQLAWNPDEFRLLVSGPSTCPMAITGATSSDGGATFDLETSEMTTGSCAVGTTTVTSVVRLPPQLGAGSFKVRYAGGVWTVPRTVLAPSSATDGSAVDSWAEAGGNELGISAVARTVDNRLAVRTTCSEGARSTPQPVVRMMTNQQLKVSASSRFSACGTGGDEHEFFFELPAGTDLHRSLTLEIDTTTVELPGL